MRSDDLRANDLQRKLEKLMEDYGYNSASLPLVRGYKYVTPTESESLSKLLH